MLSPKIITGLKLQDDLQRIISEALDVDAAVFKQLVEEATELICRENGRVGAFEVYGRLVSFSQLGEALVIGDLHGDLESLAVIFERSNFIQRMQQNSNSVAVFLGDYGDRGQFSAEVYYVILKLKMLFPRQIVLLRGNHEGPEDLTAYPHDLPFQFRNRFGRLWRETYEKIRTLFEYLYNAVIIKDRLLMLHGGLSLQTKTLEDLAFAHKKHPNKPILEDLLWSDPSETIDETCPSPRGAGVLFGRKITEKILHGFGVKLLIRGHEPCQWGFKINHDGRILTLFSRKGPPYFNEYGAYLLMNFSVEFQNAEQLASYIYTF
ncbi:MAG: metallophosphoesterase [Candidatus Bathyarchaeia archaeon]